MTSLLWIMTLLPVIVTLDSDSLCWLLFMARLGQPPCLNHLDNVQVRAMMLKVVLLFAQF